MPSQCLKFNFIRQEKDIGLNLSSITHQMCHLGQVAIFEPLTWEGGAKGRTNIYFILIGDSGKQRNHSDLSQPGLSLGYYHC